LTEHYYTASPTGAHHPARLSVPLDAPGGVRTLLFETDAGVFSRGELDAGTALLLKTALKHLAERPAGTLLDLGCGWGALGVCVGAARPEIEITLSDVNARAVGLARRNAEANGVTATAVQSDGFERLAGFYDIIVSNPPIRAGKDTLHRLLDEARAHLTPGGTMLLVWRKRQGAPSAKAWLAERFAEVETAARSGGYWVLRCQA